jgi:hypothetical protein
MFPVTYFLLKFSPLSKLEPAVGDLSFHPWACGGVSYSIHDRCPLTGSNLCGLRFSSWRAKLTWNSTGLIQTDLHREPGSSYWQLLVRQELPVLLKVWWFDGYQAVGNV